jgi:hypothetical protein
MKQKMVPKRSLKTTTSSKKGGNITKPKTIDKDKHQKKLNQKRLIKTNMKTTTIIIKTKDERRLKRLTKTSNQNGKVH